MPLFRLLCVITVVLRGEGESVPFFNLLPGA